jgi:hypothetical protein
VARVGEVLPHLVGSLHLGGSHSVNPYQQRAMVGREHQGVSQKNLIYCRACQPRTTGLYRGAAIAQRPGRNLTMEGRLATLVCIAILLRAYPKTLFCGAGCQPARGFRIGSKLADVAGAATGRMGMQMEGSLGGTKPRRRGPRFTLSMLFILFAVISLVLSRHYPRMYSSVTLDLGCKSAADAHRVGCIVRLPTVIRPVVQEHAEIATIADGNSINWLVRQIRTSVTEDNMIRLTIIGSPADQELFQKTLESVATQLDAFLRRDNALRNRRLEQLQLEAGLVGNIADPEVRGWVVEYLAERNASEKRHAFAHAGAARIVERKSGYTMLP